MKKTNAKGPVKKIQAPVQINQDQKERDKIANDMAVLFEKKITASALAKWLVIANTHSDPHDDLIWSLGYQILPGLIDAKNLDSRITFLKKVLPNVFAGYQFANKSLFQLCEDYFKKNKDLGFDIESIEEFMHVSLTLLAICAIGEKFENKVKEQKEAA